jgi:DNA-binding Lrp family transcriptional regulator
MKKNNPLREKIYQIYKENNGVLPPFRKIAKMIGVSSTNTVAYHINKLKKKGYFSPGVSKNGIVEFNLKNIIGFESKSGVYALLKKNIPFYVGESENLKSHLIGEIIGVGESAMPEIKNDLEKIQIAYYLIEDSVERKNLKDYLINFYKEKGFYINF